MREHMNAGDDERAMVENTETEEEFHERVAKGLESARKGTEVGMYLGALLDVLDVAHQQLTDRLSEADDA